MNITEIEINLLLNAMGFMIGLAALVLLFSVFKRTKADVKTSFMLFLFGVLAFTCYEILRILELYSGETFFAELFSVLFILMIMLGVYKLKNLIKGLSDFGQAFVITNNNRYEEKISSIVKDAKGVCYVTLDASFEKIRGFLEKKNVDTSSIKFLDATSEKCSSDNCTKVTNKPDDVKNAIKRILKEENIKCVVIDDVTSIKDLEKFEIPLFIQETASLIKSNESQGFFIGKIEKVDKQMINDITMLVDKVIGD